MGESRAEIDEGISSPGLEPLLHEGSSTLELEGGRYAVVRLIFVRLVRLPVSVQVDESRRHRQPTDIHDLVARERLGRDLDDPLAANPHVADDIESGFGVHDAPTQKNDVVAFLRTCRGAEKQCDRN